MAKSEFLSDEEVFGAKSAPTSPFLSDEEVFSKKKKPDAIDEGARAVGPRLFESLKTGVKSAVSNAAGLVDMVAGIPGQALGVGVDMGARLMGGAMNEPRRATAQSAAAIKSKVAEHPLNVLSSPVKKLMGALGYDSGYDESDVSNAMRTFSSWIDKGGDWVERHTGGAVLKEDFASLADMAMLAGGARGVDATVKAAKANRADTGVGNRQGYRDFEARKAETSRRQAEVDAAREQSQAEWAERYGTAEAAERTRAESQARWAQSRLKEPTALKCMLAIASSLSSIAIGSSFPSMP